MMTRPTATTDRVRAGAVLLAALACAACASAPEPTFEPRHFEWSMYRALKAYEGDDIRGALDCIADAMGYADSEQQTRLARLLRVEILVGGERLDEAAAALQALREEGVDAQVEELEGKLALARGDYGAATQTFSDLSRQASTSSSRQRFEDMRVMSAGLEAYAGGRYRDAVQSWNQLRDPRVRASLIRAVRQVMAADEVPTQGGSS